MTTLTRWNPIRDLWNLQDYVNRVFDEPFFRSYGAFGPATTANVSRYIMPLDIVELEDKFILQSFIPGINPDELDITMTDNVLTIKGEIPEEHPEGNWLLRERFFGKFSRSVQMPVPVDVDKIEATYENGVLTLYLPKAEEVMPKHIRVHANGHSQKVLEGKAA